MSRMMFASVYNPRPDEYPSQCCNNGDEISKRKTYFSTTKESVRHDIARFLVWFVFGLMTSLAIGRHLCLRKSLLAVPLWLCFDYRYRGFMKSLLPLIYAATLFTGCATNPYSKFYQSYRIPVAVQQRLLPSAAEPRIISASSQSHRAESRHLEEKGFICVGFSGFVGGVVNKRQIIKQAEKVEADTVIQTSEYSHTEQGVRPVFTYQPGQTYMSTYNGTVNANVYGGGGYAYGSGTYSGTSITTSSGSGRMDYVPYQKQVFQNGASYWRRMKPGIFGAKLTPIPDDLRSSLHRNTGVFVDIVIDNGPAFRANILQGDVIIQLADKPVVTVEEFIGFLPEYAGQRVRIKVIRADETVDVDVQLGQELRSALKSENLSHC